MWIAKREMWHPEDIFSTYLEALCTCWKEGETTISALIMGPQDLRKQNSSEFSLGMQGKNVEILTHDCCFSSRRDPLGQQGCLVPLTLHLFLERQAAWLFCAGEAENKACIEKNVSLWLWSCILVCATELGCRSSLERPVTPSTQDFTTPYYTLEKTSLPPSYVCRKDLSSSPLEKQTLNMLPMPKWGMESSASQSWTENHSLMLSHYNNTDTLSSNRAVATCPMNPGKRNSQSSRSWWLESYSVL